MIIFQRINCFGKIGTKNKIVNQIVNLKEIGIDLSTKTVKFTFQIVFSRSNRRIGCGSEPNLETLHQNRTDHPRFFCEYTRHSQTRIQHGREGIR